MSGWWGPGSAKEQYLQQLRARVGHPDLLSFGPPFRFDADRNRWRNIDQLEAVAEFYTNFTEPWGGGTPPRPGDPHYVTVSLRDPHGESAAISAGAVVMLDGSPDLSDVIPDPAANPPATVGEAGGVSPPRYPPRLKFLYDTLWLEADTARPSQTYRIMTVNNQAKSVTLDDQPNCPNNNSRWRINRRPTIIIIDPLGPRVRGGVTLSGADASVARSDPANPGRTILHLADAASLDRVNPGFDTIHLDSDSVSKPARPGPVYRIAACDTAAREITVEGAPSLEGGISAWQIPAGVGGVSANLNYDLGPQFAQSPNPDKQARGYDHYDGALFLVYRGRVEGRQIYRWSSYTSRVGGTWSGGNWQQDLSSVAGNARYYYSSYRSGDAFKNFTFAVVDATPSQAGLQPVTNDSIAAARFYTGTPAPPAPAVPGHPDALDPRVWADNVGATAGKTNIRLHRGNLQGCFGNGSAGCMVSPQYFAMRADLLRLFERDYAEYYGPNTFDAEVRKLVNTQPTPAANTNLWTPGPLALTGPNWQDKVVGSIWVIRPDERPVTGP